jgi:hypothetical protein
VPPIDRLWLTAIIGASARELRALSVRLLHSEVFFGMGPASASFKLTTACAMAMLTRSRLIRLCPGLAAFSVLLGLSRAGLFVGGLGAWAPR